LNSPKTKFSIEKLDLGKEILRILKNKISMFKEKKLDVKNNISKNIFVMADKLRLEELLTNLLENAEKYSKEKGKIVLDAELGKDFVKVSIKDTGIGLSKEQIKYVFEEFFKADKSRHDFQSSGLGMTISKKIVEKHDGNIWIESPGIDKGATVYFTLPLYKENSK
jgi:signal transduction histidine kinase